MNQPTGTYDNGNPDVPANYAPDWYRAVDRVVVGFTVLFLPLVFLAAMGGLGATLYALLGQ